MQEETTFEASEGAGPLAELMFHVADNGDEVEIGAVVCKLHDGDPVLLTIAGPDFDAKVAYVFRREGLAYPLTTTIQGNPIALIRWLPFGTREEKHSLVRESPFDEETKGAMREAVPEG